MAHVPLTPTHRSRKITVHEYDIYYSTILYVSMYCMHTFLQEPHFTLLSRTPSKTSVTILRSLGLAVDDTHTIHTHTHTPEYRV